MRLRGLRAAPLLAVLLMLSGCGFLAGNSGSRVIDVPSATLPPSPSEPPPIAYPSPIPPPPTAAPTGPTPVPIFSFSIVGAEYGFLQLNVAVGAVCNPTITYPDGAVDKLPPMTSGATEKVSWNYVQKPRGEGMARVVAICTLAGKSDTETAEFETVN